MLRVVAFPDDDENFVRRVTAAVAQLEGESGARLDVRDTLLSALGELMADYPNLELRQQDGLASFEAEPRTWYVYRDGRALAR